MSSRGRTRSCPTHIRFYTWVEVASRHFFCISRQHGRFGAAHSIALRRIMVLLRIGMPGENGEGAVELLGEHGTGELVRERQGRERKLLRRTTAERVRKTLSGTAQKDNFARAAVARLAQPFSKLRRGLMLSRVIEHD